MCLMANPENQRYVCTLEFCHQNLLNTFRQGPLITDGRNSNEMGFSNQNIIRKDDLGISKEMKISLPNFNDMDFRPVLFFMAFQHC